MRREKFINSLLVFETNISFGIFIHEFIQFLVMETISPNELSIVAIEKLLQGLTETFTQQENQEQLTKVIAASEAAKTTFSNYFGEKGEYPAKKFLNDL